jgi:hypothetical protein
MGKNDAINYKMVLSGVKRAMTRRNITCFLKKLKVYPLFQALAHRFTGP